MKNLLLTVSLFGISILCFAQKQYQDFVYLRNGGKIRCVIYELLPYKEIKVYTENGDTLFFKADEIENLTREEVVDKNKYRLTKGYQGIIEMGGSSTINRGISGIFKLYIINSYRINPFLSAGIGTGLRSVSPYVNLFDYYSKVTNNFAVPVFVDSRFNLPVPVASPFIGLSAGYSFDVLSHKTSGYDYVTVHGILVSVTSGVSWIVSGKYCINLGIYYEKQKCKTSTYFNRNPVSNNLGLSIGLTF
jgi:hypothetical protein